MSQALLRRNLEQALLAMSRESLEQARTSLGHEPTAQEAVLHWIEGGGAERYAAEHEEILQGD